MGRTTGYRSALAVGEFRVLLATMAVSSLGDQLARVALAVLVFDRTGSSLASAGTLAVTYLTYVVAGPLLATTADRLPRRGLMVGCDLVRAVALAAMAWSEAPLLVLIALLVLAETATAPFEAARGALLPEVLDGDAYVVGSGLLSTLHQLLQVAGFAVGGLLLLALTPTEVLGLNAASFAVSAAVLHARLRARPAQDPSARSTPWRDLRRGCTHVLSSPRLRVLLPVAWLASAVVVLPEGLAAGLAAASGAGPTSVGLLMAAGPAGCAVGAVVVTRLVPAARRELLLVPLLLLTCAPLVLVALDPSLVVLAGLVGLSGAGSSCFVLVQTTVGREVPSHLRGRVFGIAAGGLMGAQGLALVGGGALASVVPVHLVLAGTGVAGLVAAGALAMSWARVAEVPVPTPPVPTPPTQVPARI